MRGEYLPVKDSDHGDQHEEDPPQPQNEEVLLVEQVVSCKEISHF